MSGAALGEVVLLDLAAPGARLRAALLDELLEPLEVALDPVVRDPGRVADLLHRAFRLDLHLDGDAGGVVVEAVEGDDAAIGGAARRGPGHPLVRRLLGDLGVPPPLPAGPLGDPVKAGGLGPAHRPGPGPEA